MIIRMNVWGPPEHFQPITADSVYLLRDWLKKFINQTNQAGIPSMEHKPNQQEMDDPNRS